MFARSSTVRGVTLIMVAGVLAVLSALGAGFYTLILSQQASAARYTDSVRAELASLAGIHFAVAELRSSAHVKIEDPSDEWYTTDWLHGAAKNISYPARDHTQRDASGQPLKKAYSRLLDSVTGSADATFSLEVSDASGKININACDNLGVVLDNLCRVIGAPLTAADPDWIQPDVWGTLGATGYSANTDDRAGQGACYYMPTKAGSLFVDLTKAPVLGKDGLSARYGDGYAIARYRAAHGKFENVNEIKAALTVTKRPAHPELETLERELKFAAIKDYITIDSWVDTTTVCVGKFEWVKGAIAFDRDKSWIEDDPIHDPDNQRGSLRGSYLSILTGQAAGTLRRIKTNGVDWVEVDVPFTVQPGPNGGPVVPGPISDYMIVSKEEALTVAVNDKVSVPKQDPTTGVLVPDPKIDYHRFPLCIHRAPVNINTASDKVLTALFMGININHGHYMSVGTDVDVDKTASAWFKPDPQKVERQISTLMGMMRVPVSSGKVIYDKPVKSVLPSPLPPGYDLNYINNYGSASLTGAVTEAHELALRIIMARQLAVDAKTGKIKAQADPYNGVNSKNKYGYAYSYLTGPFKSWDDFYFRIVQPWDELRYENDNLRGHAAPLIMANFNPNTDILKFNPGIEWIDRWGRNFTELESIFARDNDGLGEPIWVQGNDPNYNANYAEYVVRNIRYKADEMIDKTDLNRSTTEFCFDSGGIFNIKSTGRVTRNGAVVAERQYETLVQIYDVWRETTQRQFVQGTMSEALYPTARDGSLDQFNYAGKPVRDAKDHGGKRLALDTLPEPLVPLNYVIKHEGRNADVVDVGAPQGRDCYGKEKKTAGAAGTIPDVVANQVQPASFDGQIVLATNTARYGEANEEMDTFLASFNGDLDTDTSVGNGREQAKSPGDARTRVLDTCSILGVLGDDDPKHIDYDMQDATVPPYNTYRIANEGTGLKPLKASRYWDGVTMRQGDLRAEGVWMGFTGCSGNEATIKYLIDISGGTGINAKRKNFNPEDGVGAMNGCTVCMWYKPAWAQDDNRYHEFFNVDNPGNAGDARYFSLYKGKGHPWEVGSNFLTAPFEDQHDNDFYATLTGSSVVVDPLKPSDTQPPFRIQPFRWGFVGGTYRYNYLVDSQSGDGAQAWNSADPHKKARNVEYLNNVNRCFINTQKNPEGPLWTGQYLSTQDPLMSGRYVPDHCDIGSSVRTDTPGSSGFAAKNPLLKDFKNWNQEAAWAWTDGGSKTNPKANAPIFGANNLNGTYGIWIYRDEPIAGTMSVVDEYKIAKKAWNTDLIARVMAVSRYYLPPSPENRAQCPVFQSQTLQQSIHGVSVSKSAVAAPLTRPIRVTWTCFTPRFMHETIPSLGHPEPFDYLAYNFGRYNSAGDHPFVPKLDRLPKGVARPTLLDYLAVQAPQAHSASGVEIEVLNDLKPIEGESEATPGKFVKKGSVGTPFSDPNVLNRFPETTPAVAADKLRYQVRFRYPIEPYFGGGSVKPGTQYMLDTPVFDDITILYEIPPRYFYMRPVTE